MEYSVLRGMHRREGSKHPPAGVVFSAQMPPLRDDVLVGILGALLQSCSWKAGSHSFLENFYGCLLLFITDMRKSENLNFPAVPPPR